jgi:membrane-anchored protein YejM (alkaline phosphatase superfamily)
MSPLLILAIAVAVEANVVLITWDGVRREEFVDPRRLPRFWSKHAAGGLVVGGPMGAVMEVADPRLISLPAYQSIFVGALTGCAGNSCGRAPQETFPERLVRELSLPRASVAVFASWRNIAHAVEHAPGTITVNAGPDGTGAPPPWDDARRDSDTFALAMRYLATQRPRFLYLALDDSDEWAHRGDLERYRATLLQYDEWLDMLLDAIESMGDYGKRTTVIVTTDHGRGAGERWTEHGAGDPSARSIWLFARGPGVKPGVANSPATHLDLRPTVEALFGLCSPRAPIKEFALAACKR